MIEKRPPRLAGEVARLAHETKTEAIRRALLERVARLRTQHTTAGARKGLRAYMEQNVWPTMPSGELGRVIGHEEEDRILGHGTEGY